MSVTIKVVNPTTTFKHYVIEVKEAGQLVGKPMVAKDLLDVVELVAPYKVYLLDIDEAIEVLDENDHNVAHFGVLGSFMYSTFEGVAS
jgi:SpoU rRNA methylase family enzyme